MNKKEKVKFISKTLQELYPDITVPLYHTNIFTLLIAVLLSAQSTDKKVNQIAPFLFAKASSPEEMVLLSITEIKNTIKEIGLYNTKAKNIWNLSKLLIERHDSRVPDSFGELEALPGVGHKTASVVMIQGFKKHAFPVDTHIHRLMHRWGLSSGEHPKQTEKDAKALFPKRLWARVHLQIIYYAREYSPARGWKLQKDIITQRITTNRQSTNSTREKRIL